MSRSVDASITTIEPGAGFWTVTPKRPLLRPVVWIISVGREVRRVRA